MADLNFAKPVTFQLAANGIPVLVLTLTAKVLLLISFAKSERGSLKNTPFDWFDTTFRLDKAPPLNFTATLEPVLIVGSSKEIPLDTGIKIENFFSWHRTIKPAIRDDS